MIGANNAGAGRAEAILESERRVLDLIGEGASLRTVLETLCQTIEELSTPGLLASILLLDDDGMHLRNGAAPSLPESYSRQLEGVAIGPSAGSCGTAAFRKQPVAVSDIAADPLWATYRDLALQHGLRACWSTPIISRGEKVLGTFALYYREPREPHPQDMQLLSLATRTAAIAIGVKRAEDELREKQHFIEHVAEAAPFILYVFDLIEQKNVYANSQLFKTLGYEQGKSQEFVNERLHPDDLAATVAHVQKVAAAEDGEVLEQEYRIRHANGQWRSMCSRNVVFTRTPDGKARQILGTAEDITDRKRAEDALKHSEGRLRSITENAPDVILLFDRQGTISFINRAMPPHTPAEVVGTKAADWVPEGHRQPLRLAVQKVFATAQPQQYEVPVILASIGKRWYNSRISPVIVDGKVVSAVVCARDVTEQKQAEEKLKSEERLLRKLLDLQERERRLIAYEIHDGFLQYVVGATMLLESACHRLPESDGGCSEELEAARKILRKAIDEGRRMVSDLRPLIIDEDGIVEALHFLVAEQQTKGGLQIEFVHEVQFDRLAPLLEGTIFRIVQEALTNVKRHSRADQAELRLVQKGNRVQLEIRDRGIGFDATKLPDDRFGLEGIRKRAELFGGEARIVSSPGEGTLVRVELPLAFPDKPQGPRADS